MTTTAKVSLMALLVIAAHLLDLVTFWLALTHFGVSISAEQNPWMVAAYTNGGYLLILASKLAFVSVMLAMMARITTKPLLPAFLVAYSVGLLGAAANVSVMLPSLVGLAF